MNKEIRKPMEARTKKPSRRVITQSNPDSLAFALYAARLIITQMHSSKKNS